MVLTQLSHSALKLAREIAPLFALVRGREASFPKGRRKEQNDAPDSLIDGS